MIRVLKLLLPILAPVGETLFKSFLMYLLILIPYLVICVLLVLISILIGEMVDLVKFTQLYFYNGTFLFFIAWRIHLAYFFFCVIRNLNPIFEDGEN